MNGERPKILNLLGVEVHLVPEKGRGATLSSYRSDPEKGSPLISIGETSHGFWYAVCYLRIGSVASYCLNTGIHGTPQQAVEALADQILTMKRELFAFAEVEDGARVS